MELAVCTSDKSGFYPIVILGAISNVFQGDTEDIGRLGDAERAYERACKGLVVPHALANKSTSPS
jgi:hypothetical protein